MEPLHKIPSFGKRDKCSQTLQEKAGSHREPVPLGHVALLGKVPLFSVPSLKEETTVVSTLQGTFGVIYFTPFILQIWDIGSEQWSGQPKKAHRVHPREDQAFGGHAFHWALYHPATGSEHQPRFSSSALNPPSCPRTLSFKGLKTQSSHQSLITEPFYL